MRGQVACCAARAEARLRTAAAATARSGKTERREGEAGWLTGWGWGRGREAPESSGRSRRSIYSERPSAMLTSTSTQRARAHRVTVHAPLSSFGLTWARTRASLGGFVMCPVGAPGRPMRTSSVLPHLPAHPPHPTYSTPLPAVGGPGAGREECGGTSSAPVAKGLSLQGGGEGRSRARGGLSERSARPLRARAAAPRPELSARWGAARHMRRRRRRQGEASRAHD